MRKVILFALAAMAIGVRHVRYARSSLSSYCSGCTLNPNTMSSNWNKTLVISFSIIKVASGNGQRLMARAVDSKRFVGHGRFMKAGQLKKIGVSAFHIKSLIQRRMPMGTKFNQCPNCGRKVGGAFSSQFYIYECRKCGTHYCSYCGKDRCPDCASKDKRDAGYVKG